MMSNVEQDIDISLGNFLKSAKQKNQFLRSEKWALKTDFMSQDQCLSPVFTKP